LSRGTAEEDSMWLRERMLAWWRTGTRSGFMSSNCSSFSRWFFDGEAVVIFVSSY
jgi:hypothetical protein